MAGHTVVTPPPEPRPPIRVFLVDDHEIVRRGLVDLLSGDPDLQVVGEASTCDQARRRIPVVGPAVVLLDARLPDGSGIDVCRDIRAVHPEIACLVLTSYDDDESILAAVMAGASGFLLKQIRATSLTEAVHRVADGESLIDPAVTARLLAKLQAPAPTQADDRDVELTDREREILDLIAEGLTNRQIGSRLFLAEKTVKNYVSLLLAKLGMERRTQAAVYAARRKS